MGAARESMQNGVRGFLGILHSNVLGAAAPAAVHAFAGLLDAEKGAQHHQSQHCGEAGIERYQNQFVTARNGWGDDSWGIGQIMSLSLWLPTILETVYLTIGMAQLFQLVLYVRLANWGLVTIVGEERGLTERLPQPWVAALTGSNTPSAPGPGEP